MGRPYNHGPIVKEVHVNPYLNVDNDWCIWQQHQNISNVSTIGNHVPHYCHGIMDHSYVAYHNEEMEYSVAWAHHSTQQHDDYIFNHYGRETTHVSQRMSPQMPQQNMESQQFPTHAEGIIRDPTTPEVQYLVAHQFDPISTTLDSLEVEFSKKPTMLDVSTSSVTANRIISTTSCESPS